MAGCPMPLWLTPSLKTTMRSPGAAWKAQWWMMAGRPLVVCSSKRSRSSARAFPFRSTTQAGLSYSTIRVAPRGSMSTMVKVE